MQLYLSSIHVLSFNFVLKLTCLSSYQIMKNNPWFFFAVVFRQIIPFFGTTVCFQLYSICVHPVIWGCRIPRLPLCIGLRHPPNKGTSWLWVVTPNALERDHEGYEALDQATEWSSNLQLSILLFTVSDGWSERSDLINRLDMLSPNNYMFILDRILLSSLVANIIPFLSYRSLKAVAESQFLWENKIFYHRKISRQ